MHLHLFLVPIIRTTSYHIGTKVLNQDRSAVSNTVRSMLFWIVSLTHKMYMPTTLPVMYYTEYNMRHQGTCPTFLKSSGIVPVGKGVQFFEQYLMGSIYEIIECVIFSYIRITFMIVGHMKTSPNRSFATLAKSWYFQRELHLGLPATLSCYFWQRKNHTMVERYRIKTYLGSVLITTL